MIDLILDTNIWIHKIALDEPRGIFKKLESFVETDEIHLLTNDIIIDEWQRNKSNTINQLSNKIREHSESALRIMEFLDESNKSKLDDILKEYKTKEERRLDIAEKRIDDIEKMITSADKTEVTTEMKLKVVNWALEKKAPFSIKKNSVGDALIILSAIEFRKRQITPGFYPKGFFVSYNHTDYSDPQNKDLIHPDLEEVLEEGNLHYVRHLDKTLLKLAPDELLRIQKYIDYVQDDY